MGYRLYDEVQAQVGKDWSRVRSHCIQRLVRDNSNGVGICLVPGSFV